MTKHAFLEGMGLGVLAGAAIGMAVAARGMQNPDVRRAARKAGRLRVPFRVGSNNFLKLF